MSTDLKPVHEYIKAIERELVAGNATEHTHRSALKSLIEGLDEGITATNEPTHIECGAPDFVVTKGVTTIGYIEAKDVGKSLDEAEKSEQLKRYRDSLTNLVLTDYLKFRWYVDGQRRVSARLGTQTKEGKIKRDKAGVEPVAELLSSFLSRKAEAVGTPRELALRMARLAHMIRNLIVNAFEKEPEAGSLHAQLSAFRDNLIPNLSVEQFADMYAQTIAYGLFAARCTNSGGKDFTRQDAAYLLPKTNPFLRKLFNHIAGPDLDDRIAWLVDDLAQVLAQADMAAVLQDFGKHTAKEDPVVHFYETFLTAYDPKVREMRGVYYTPEPVVSYIVRSIDHLLKTRFNRQEGLMDANTLILDPAVGTATFLYMVINEIHEAIVSQGQKGLWNDYVTEKLLPRLFGFELLMAPYAVAHLKLGLLLQETGYEFKTDQRLGIYLTNSLEEAFKKSELLPGFNKYIVDEANAAAEIKKEKPIMVVLGNPPYSGASVNKGKWITNLINGVFDKDGNEIIPGYKMVDNKPLDERNPKWLQDDYVKFIRFGQWRIERTEQGILGFITNHSYLDNPTFRGMRQSLMNTFSDIYVLDLHGNVMKRKVVPNDRVDENVFDIQQGVAIGLFVKELGKTGTAKVHHADLWGLRGDWPDPEPGTKYHTLAETDIASIDWTVLQPHSPFYFFLPRHEDVLTEYEQGWRVTDIFPIYSVGILTHRDHFAVDLNMATLRKRITEFRGTSLTDDQIHTKFNLGTWDNATSRMKLRKDEQWDSRFLHYLYRPFDIRAVYYSHNVIVRPRHEVMQHMLHKNTALVTQRQTYGWPFRHIFAANMLSDLNLTSNLGGGSVFPLYLYSLEEREQPDKSGGKEGGIQPVMETQTKHEPNLNPEFIKTFSEKLGLNFVEDGKVDLEKTFGPEDIFNYAYAVFHSPTYRTRYAELLEIDFPRLPLTSNRELFKTLAEKGAELVSLHLMESPVLNNLITKYPVTGSNVVEKVSYNEITKRVNINKEQHFEGVPSEVWSFYIGGYQVCQKWLKDRKGRMLTYDEAEHYQKIVVALKETIRLMAEIDALIPSWPIE
jgi:predicted helicase